MLRRSPVCGLVPFPFVLAAFVLLGSHYGEVDAPDDHGPPVIPGTGSPAAKSKRFSDATSKSAGEKFTALVFPLLVTHSINGPILIIEDDLAIRETLGELMRLEGYTPELAANGQEAIRLLESGVRPCLILLDLMMPVMDGFAFRAEQMKNSRWSEIPVVVMSADGNLQAKMERLGGNLPSLRKPPDIDAVIDAVRRYCRAIGA